MIIAILGPDGSGKTTIANMLVDALSRECIDARHHAHRFGILPPLGVFRLRRKKSTHDMGVKCSKGTLSYDLKENSALRAFVYVSWYGIDYLCGGILLRLQNTFGNRRRAAIFARYFYDYYYQSNNRRLNNRVKRLVEIIVPRPDFIFFLDRDAQEIHDGKPELPVEEIKRQQQIIRKRLGSYAEFYCVDARSGPEHTAEQILHLLASSVS